MHIQIGTLSSSSRLWLTPSPVLKQGTWRSKNSYECLRRLSIVKDKGGGVKLCLRKCQITKKIAISNKPIKILDTFLFCKCKQFMHQHMDIKRVKSNPQILSPFFSNLHNPPPIPQLLMRVCMMQKHVEQTSLPHSRKIGIPPSYSSQHGGGGLVLNCLQNLGWLINNNINIMLST